MANIRQLANAPIREAIIDIQTNSVVDLAILEAIEAKLQVKFKKEPIWQALMGFELDEDGQSTPKAQKSSIGYRYTFADSPLVMLCRDRGFTFSHLYPYTSWEKLSVEAKNLWNVYKEIVNPSGVSRIAVRYINNLQIPLPISDFGDFFTSPPLVPAGLPQSLASFLQRYLIVDSNDGKVAAVTQALEDSRLDPSKVSFLFDIDAFRVFENLEPDTEKIWEVLNSLREFKNDIFFKYLTEKTIQIYE